MEASDGPGDGPTAKPDDAGAPDTAELAEATTSSCPASVDPVCDEHPAKPTSVTPASAITDTSMLARDVITRSYRLSFPHRRRMAR